MSEEKKPRKSHIEKLKERLYSPKFKEGRPQERGQIYDVPHTVSYAWKKDAPPPPPKKRKSLLKNSMFRNFFFGAIIFFLICVIFGAIMFFGGKNTVSANNIDINVLGNAFVSGGEELPLKVEITNRNKVSLEYADLVLEYKKGSGAEEETQRDRFTVGTVPAGGQVEKLANIVLFGQQGTSREVNITLEYRVKGSSAIFIKPELYVVNISSTPVNLVVDGPEVTNTNQNVTFNIDVSPNTEEAIQNMMVVVDYPPGFDFKSATPAPTFSDHIWSLGDIAKGVHKKISVSGVIVAEPGEFRAFNVYVGSADPKDEQSIGTQFNSQSYKLAIEKPFLDLRLSVAGSFDDESVANGNDFTDGIISFANNLDTKITDVEITARFSGNAFSPNLVDARDGFYDSANQTIVWNSQTADDLSEINPGDRNNLKFNFKPISFTNGSVTNPEINIEVSITGREPSLGNNFQTIENLIKKKVKYKTDIQVAGNAMYYSGTFQNSGPLPPTPGSPTTYTIVWNVANTTNKVTDAKVVGTLPVYVDWTNKISDNSITFNPSTREVIWNIGNLDAGTGTSSSPKKGSFQVRLNPSITQVNTPPNLVTGITLTGEDSFTGSSLSRTMSPINTRLNLDSNYNSANDLVQ